jgi:hypothetical protein
METIVIGYIFDGQYQTEEYVLQDNWVEQCYELDRLYYKWEVIA